jgi:hypothetical protein
MMAELMAEVDINGSFVHHFHFAFIDQTYLSSRSTPGSDVNNFSAVSLPTPGTPVGR